MAAVNWACVQTGSTSTGSTCDLNTTMHALIPGATKDKKRSIWALDDVQIYDGGADGDGDTTTDNTVFVGPGLHPAMPVGTRHFDMRVITRLLLGGVAALCLLTATSAQATRPRPTGRDPASGVARSRIRAVHRVESHARAAARVRVVQPARTDLRAGYGGHYRRLRRRRELDRLSPPRVSARALEEIAFLSTTTWLLVVALKDVRCVPTGTRCGTANASGPDDYAGEMRLTFRVRLTDHRSVIRSGRGNRFRHGPGLHDGTVRFSLGVCAERIDFDRFELRHEHKSAGAGIPGAAIQRRSTLDLGAG